MTYAKAAEKALIEDARKLLAPDFIVRAEVPGKHWTGTPVQIDLAIYPLPHTVARGFPAVWLGIEAKVIDFAQTQCMARLSGLLAQCNSYVQSRFQLPTPADEVSLAGVFILLPPEKCTRLNSLQRLTTFDKQREMIAIMETMLSFNIGRLRIEKREYRFFFGSALYADQQYVTTETNTGLIPRIGSRTKTPQRHERDLALMARLYQPVTRKPSTMTLDTDMSKVVAALTAEYADREDLQEAIVAHLVQIHYPHLIAEIRAAVNLAMDPKVQKTPINTAQLTNVAQGILLIAYEYTVGYGQGKADREREYLRTMLTESM